MLDARGTCIFMRMHMYKKLWIYMYIIIHEYFINSVLRYLSHFTVPFSDGGMLSS